MPSCFDVPDMDAKTRTLVEDVMHKKRVGVLKRHGTVPSAHVNKIFYLDGLGLGGTAQVTLVDDTAVKLVIPLEATRFFDIRESIQFHNPDIFDMTEFHQDDPHEGLMPYVEFMDEQMRQSLVGLTACAEIDLREFIERFERAEERLAKRYAEENGSSEKVVYAFLDKMMDATERKTRAINRYLVQPPGLVETMKKAPKSPPLPPTQPTRG